MNLRLFNKTKLIKDPLKGMAALMYQDVSDDPWDQENLTKRNLDFGIESVRFIDQYANRLMNSKNGSDLLNQHFENFVTRIGAYIGEVIRIHHKSDLVWYESRSVSSYSQHNYAGFNAKNVLYDKRRDIVISPLDEVSDFLQGKSSYESFLVYTEDMLKSIY